MNYYLQVEKVIVKEYNYNSKTEYGKNRMELDTCYKVGKFLSKEIRNSQKSKDDILKKYSKEIFRNTKIKYSPSELDKMITFNNYLESRMLLSNQVSWSHYKELIKLTNISLINQYINEIMFKKISVKELKKLLNNAKETLN